MKLIHDKRSSIDVTPVNILIFVVLSLIITYFVNFLLNQVFGTKFLPLGQPMRFMIIGVAILLSSYIIIQRHGTLGTSDWFAIGLVIIGAFTLFYFLPSLLPEAFSSYQGNTILSLINSAYTNSNSPVQIWYNASVYVHNSLVP